MNKLDIAPPAGNKSNKKEPTDEYAVQYGDEPNIIADTNAEMAVLKNSFKSKMDLEKQSKEQNTNPNFWFAVYFQDEAQKNEFLQKAGVDKITAGQYIDGLELAKTLGIDIERKEMKIPGKFKSFKSQ